MKRFLILVALVWVAAWLPIGIWAGDLDYVLSRVSRDTEARRLYQILLYAGILVVFFDSWRRHRPPRPRWRGWRLLPLYFLQGLAATLVLRGLLSYAGLADWEPAGGSALHWVAAVFSCLTVALVEEAVFRGFLLGGLATRYGRERGAWLSSLLFATVHLFRPGDLLFKVSYGVGLLLFGYLLARIAWRHDSLPAAVGFHAGVILLNIATQLVTFQPSIWSGGNSEPVAGLLSWLLTLSYLLIWLRLSGSEGSRSPSAVHDCE